MSYSVSIHCPNSWRMQNCLRGFMYKRHFLLKKTGLEIPLCHIRSCSLKRIQITNWNMKLAKGFGEIEMGLTTSNLLCQNNMVRSLLLVLSGYTPLTNPLFSCTCSLQFDSPISKDVWRLSIEAQFRPCCFVRNSEWLLLGFRSVYSLSSKWVL